MEYIDITQELASDINRIVEDYEGEEIQVADGLNWSMYDTIKKIDYWSGSRYLNGMFDRTGRRIPFFNVLNPIVDLETRATDLDISNITLKSDQEEDALRNMLFSHKLKHWMRQTRFGQTLNDIGETRARYGGVLVKRTERDGQLYIDVVDWSKIYVDPVDIENGPKIEVHYMSPTDLWAKDGKWENIKDAIELLGEDDDDTGRPEGRVKVLEVEGEFEATHFDDNAKEGKYVRKLMYIAQGEKKTVMLMEKTLKESRYKYQARKRVPNRSLGRGVYEDGFEAQMWTNEGVVSLHDILSVSSKTVILGDKKWGNNALTDIDHGQVLEADQDTRFEPVSLMSNAAPAVNATNSLIESWFTQLQRSTSAFDAVTGEQLPTSTAVRTAAIQSAQASSQFDYLREGLAFFIIEIIEDWVIPHLAKKIRNEDNLTDEFTAEELEMLDQALIANEQKKQFLKGNVKSPLDLQDIKDQLSQGLSRTNRRTVSDLKGYFDEYLKKRNFYVHITSEQGNVAAEADNIIQAIQLLDPADPTRQKLMQKLMQVMGIDVVQNVTSPTGKAPNVQKQSAIQQDVQAALPEALQ